MARALITIPPNPKRNSVIEIRALIQHPMETGLRPDVDGKVQAQNIIRRFECRFTVGDKSALVFSAEFFPAISANPYIAFPLRATQNGSLSFQWTGDKGFTQTETAALVVV
jgi:sulfur-oxidizing protein SoxZ